MTIREALLPEFDQEMAITRKTLERVPDDRFAWKPHEKSSTLGSLAGHVATLPGLAKKAITQDELGSAPAGQAPELPASLPRCADKETFSHYIADNALGGPLPCTLKIW